MGTFSVYMHKFPNNKVYIGITSTNVEKRWLKGFGYSSNKYMESAIKKYGWNNIEHIIIAEKLSGESASQMEKHLIKKHNSTNRIYGYNIRDGGLDKFSLSEETRNKISKSKKGFGPFSGKKHRDDSKKVMSEKRVSYMSNQKKSTN